MPDYGRVVGKESYPWPHDFSDEAKVQGVSLAVSKSAIPDYEPGRTRLALIHPRAVVKVTTDDMTILDLATELVCEFVRGCPAEPNPEEKTAMLARWGEDNKLDWEIAYVFDKMLTYNDDGRLVNTLELCYWLREADRAGDLKRLEEKYGIEYGLGWFGFVYLSSIQFVAVDETDELPPELIGRGVEIVNVVYEDEEGL